METDRNQPEQGRADLAALKAEYIAKERGALADRITAISKRLRNGEIAIRNAANELRKAARALDELDAEEDRLEQMRSAG